MSLGKISGKLGTTNRSLDKMKKEINKLKLNYAQAENKIKSINLNTDEIISGLKKNNAPNNIISAINFLNKYLNEQHYDEYILRREDIPDAQVNYSKNKEPFSTLNEIYDKIGEGVDVKNDEYEQILDRLQTFGEKLAAQIDDLNIKINVLKAEYNKYITLLVSDISHTNTIYHYVDVDIKDIFKINNMTLSDPGTIVGYDAESKIISMLRNNTNLTLDDDKAPQKKYIHDYKVKQKIGRAHV